MKRNANKRIFGLLFRNVFRFNDIVLFFSSLRERSIVSTNRSDRKLECLRVFRESFIKNYTKKNDFRFFIALVGQAYHLTVKVYCIIRKAGSKKDV